MTTDTLPIDDLVTAAQTARADHPEAAALADEVVRLRGRLDVLEHACDVLDRAIGNAAHAHTAEVQEERKACAAIAAWHEQRLSAWTNRGSANLAKRIKEEILAGFVPPPLEATDPYTGEDLTGKTEYCCECGNDYPRADLAVRGEIFCPACRVAEKARKQRMNGGGQ